MGVAHMEIEKKEGIMAFTCNANITTMRYIDVYTYVSLIVPNLVSSFQWDLKEEDDEVEKEEKEVEEEEEEGSVRRHFIRKASRKCSFALKQDFPSPWFKRMLEVTNDV
uniref:Uncharacterized protein n=1 Tax=Vespula pensylvanica TaxID=30213 RepID=A0A834JM18_VESPE|nr:hypothetical protein H0235_017846 [Vespula pensylvanica]